MIKSYEKLKLKSFSKGEIRRAGDVLKEFYFQRDLTLEQDIELDKAQNIINDWRGLHLYPLNTTQKFFRDNLRKIGCDEAPIGQRLKRMTTIADKLSRMKGSLDSFQDIAGIRIILKDMTEVDKFVKQLNSSKSKHKIIKTYDYILTPKPDGYRSIHYVYEAISSKAPKELTDLHLKVELQLRTELQHYWATAVESVGMFYKQSIKTGGGDPMWNQFFLCASAAFACMEGLPLPAKYENCSREDLKEVLDKINNDYLIRSKLEIIKFVSFSFKKSSKIKFISLVFYKATSGDASVQVTLHDCKEEEALSRHNFLEKTSKNIVDTVLVKADAQHLKKVYSNYFLNIDDFMENLTLFMKE